MKDGLLPKSFNNLTYFFLCIIALGSFGKNRGNGIMASVTIEALIVFFGILWVLYTKAKFT